MFKECSRNVQRVFGKYLRSVGELLRVGSICRGGAVENVFVVGLGSTAEHGFADHGTETLSGKTGCAGSIGEERSVDINVYFGCGVPGRDVVFTVCVAIVFSVVCIAAIVFAIASVPVIVCIVAAIYALAVVPVLFVACVLFAEPFVAIDGGHGEYGLAGLYRPCERGSRERAYLRAVRPYVRFGVHHYRVSETYMLVHRLGELALTQGGVQHWQRPAPRHQSAEYGNTEIGGGDNAVRAAAREGEQRNERVKHRLRMVAVQEQPAVQIRAQPLPAMDMHAADKPHIHRADYPKQRKQQLVQQSVPYPVAYIFVVMAQADVLTAALHYVLVPRMIIHDAFHRLGCHPAMSHAENV